jgi:hypothetical protein
LVDGIPTRKGGYDRRNDEDRAQRGSLSNAIPRQGYGLAPFPANECDQSN